MGQLTGEKQLGNGIIKNQIDEFSVHVQHEFWSETEGVKYFLQMKFQILVLLLRHHFLALIAKWRPYFTILSIAMVMFQNQRSHLSNETEWHWLSVQHPLNNSIILNGEAIIVGEGANSMIYSSPVNIEPGEACLLMKGFIPISHWKRDLSCRLGSSCYR